MRESIKLNNKKIYTTYSPPVFGWSSSSPHTTVAAIAIQHTTTNTIIIIIIPLLTHTHSQCNCVSLRLHITRYITLTNDPNSDKIDKKQMREKKNTYIFKKVLYTKKYTQILFNIYFLLYIFFLPTHSLHIQHHKKDIICAYPYIHSYT